MRFLWRPPLTLLKVENSVESTVIRRMVAHAKFMKFHQFSWIPSLKFAENSVSQMVFNGTPVFREMKANIPQKCHYNLKL